MYCFENFELDTDRQELRLRGKVVPIAPKAFSVLAFLVENRDRMVTKRELMDAFWTNNISEAALQKTISLVRKALEDHDPDRPLIKTYHGRGFRFMAILSPADGLPGQEPVLSGTRPLLEQRQVAVLCVSLSFPNGPSADEDKRVIVDAFLEAARDKVADAQGKLLHMMVNGFTASFGLTPHYEDSARRAAHCAWELLNSDQDARLKTRHAQVSISIDVGGVTLDHKTGGSEWQPPSVIELAASALAQRALRRGIFVTAAAQQHLRDEAEVIPFGLDFCLTSLNSDSTGIPARPSKRPTAFVGREAELAYLSGCLEKAESGQFQAATLSGPAGIGKSRLTAEFLASLEPGDVPCLKINCLPRLQNAAMAPIRQMCAHLVENKQDEFTQNPIDAALLQFLLDENTAPDPILEGLSDRKRRQRNLTLIQNILQRTAREKQLVVVYEDIHWMDATSRSVLDALVRTGGVENLFLIVTTRPIEGTPIAESMLNLPPLGTQDSLSLVREMTTTIDLDDKVVATLAQRADGNPFFLEELVLATQSGADPQVDLPDTVQAVIEVRIGEQTPFLRTLLYILAIIGDGNSLELVSHLTQRAVDEVENGLLSLVDSGFLNEATAEFSFRHMLLSDTAYAMVEKGERRRLHREIAVYWEKSGEHVRDETLAWHYQEAGQNDQAINYWCTASFAALHRSAQQDAISFAKSGLALIDPKDGKLAEQELRLRLAMATALMAVRGYGAPKVGEELERALVLGRGVGSFKTQVRVLMGLWVHTWVAGRLTTSLGHAKTLIKMADVAQDPSLNLQAHSCAGSVLTHQGQLKTAMHHLSTALAQPDEIMLKTITSQNTAVTCSAYAAWVCGMQGKADDMQTHIDRSMILSQSGENPFARAIHLALCSEAYMFAGDVAATSQLAQDAISLSREHGFPFWLGTGLVMQGWCLGQLGDFEQAVDTIDEGIRIFKNTGAGVQFTNWYGLKAEAHLRAGQIEAGLAAAEQALILGKQTGDIWFTPRIYDVMACLYSAIGYEALATENANKVQELKAMHNLADSFVSLAHENSRR